MMLRKWMGRLFIAFMGLSLATSAAWAGATTDVTQMHYEYGLVSFGSTPVTSVSGNYYFNWYAQGSDLDMVGDFAVTANLWGAANFGHARHNNWTAGQVYITALELTQNNAGYYLVVDHALAAGAVDAYDTSTLNAIPTVSVVDNGNGTVGLAWTLADGTVFDGTHASNIEGYHVWRSTDGVSWTQLTVDGSHVTSNVYTDNTVVTDGSVSYYYALTLVYYADSAQYVKGSILSASSAAVTPLVVVTPFTVGALSVPTGSMQMQVSLNYQDLPSTDSISSVLLNGQSASFNVSATGSSGVITFVVPQEAGSNTRNLQNLTVTVNTTVGQVDTANTLFTYHPYITSISPTRATVGSLLTIRGYSLSGVDVVLLVTGNISYSSLASRTATEIQVTLSSHANAFGQKLVRVRDNGIVGAQSDATQNFTFVPDITAVSPTSGVAGDTITITGSALRGIDVIKLDTVTATILVNATNVTMNVQVPAPVTGNYNAVLYVQATDTDFGVQDIATLNFHYISVPDIYLAVPTASAGRVATINGINLDNGTPNIWVGTASAEVLTFSYDYIRYRVPTVDSILNLSNDVIVSNNDGSDTLTAALYVLTLPVFDTFAPTVGVVAGTTTVDVTGLFLDTITSIYFGDNPVTTILSLTPTAMSFLAPAAAAAGSVTVSASNPDGSVSRPGQFTYLSTPSITDVSVSTGSIGDVVIIGGENINSGATVLFDTVTANVTASTDVNGDVFLYAVVPTPSDPTFTGTVDIVLINPDSASYNFEDAFVYVSASVDSGVPSGSSSVSTPSITDVSISTGSMGDVVIIGGDNIDASANVYFDTITADVTASTDVNGDVFLYAVVPTPSDPAFSGTVDIILVNPDGGTTTFDDAFVYVDVADASIPTGSSSVSTPSITDISISTGSMGDVVIIGGDNIDASANVYFDTITADVTASTDVNGDVFLYAVVPTPSDPTFTGTVDIILVNPDGGTTTFDDAFVYVADSIGATEAEVLTPDIAYISVSEGSVGDVIVISGNNIDASASVVIGGITADVTASVDDSGNVTLYVTVPDLGSDSGSMDIVISNPDGGSSTIADGFVYISSVPVLASLSPSAGDVAGSTAVTLIGSNLDTVVTVSFGGQAVTAFNSQSATQLVLLTPVASQAGVVTVSVSNPFGTDASLTFNYTRQPIISTVDPSEGSAGDIITLTGRNFDSGARIFFGSVEATSIISFTDADGNRAFSVTVPDQSEADFEGPVDIRVLNADGSEDTRLAAFGYVFSPLQAISNVSVAEFRINSIPVINGDVIDSTITQVEITLTQAVGISGRVSINVGSAAGASLGTAGTTFGGNGTVTMNSLAISLNASSVKVTINVTEAGGDTVSYNYTFTVTSVTDETALIGIPLNYPNPFKPGSGQQTAIGFKLNKADTVTLYLYSITGQLLWKTTHTGNVGYNQLSWDGRSDFGAVVGNGLYIYKLVASGKVLGTGKLVVLD